MGINIRTGISAKNAKVTFYQGLLDHSRSSLHSKIRVSFDTVPFNNFLNKNKKIFRRLKDYCGRLVLIV